MKSDITTMVLGEKYNIKYRSENEDGLLSKMDGYHDDSDRTIVIKLFEPSEDSLNDLESYSKKVLRHELVHAFLSQSGLQVCSEWAKNEEIVDWIAIQFPKMLKTFQSVGAV